MGEYDAVSASQRFAALARQIANITRQQGEDRREIGQLNEKVNGLAKAMAGALDNGKLKAPAAPRWDGLDREQLAAQLAQLRAWVNGVLLVQYPEYTVPTCWEGHRAALWELGNLAAEWTRIYADPRGADLEAALWFHERWLPGTIGRLNRAISPESNMGCSEHRIGYGQRRA